MNKFKTLILILFANSFLFAQQIEIPNNVKLETADDYKNTEPQVIKAVDWLVNTPVSQNPEKRAAVNAFLLQWLSGSPSVSIVVATGVAPMDCGDCLMVFMGGWAKYSLNNNYSSDKIECATAGVETAIEFYEKNKSALGKNSDMEKLIKQKNKGKLKEYLQSKL
ncbi:MAG: hypothetical protein H3C39_05435 [Flavobacteriia bacterium]|nr:hypothetical protein [Flavobacteriia bacterium]